MRWSPLWRRYRELVGETKKGVGDQKKGRIETEREGERQRARAREYEYILFDSILVKEENGEFLQ